MLTRQGAMVAVFLAGGVAGILAALGTFGCFSGKHEAHAAPPQPDIRVLQADVERLKKVVPDQAHVMADVDYHFANLWFAGQAENWPLAEFFWKESLSHIRWAVRVIPVRKDNAGKEVNLENILQSIENAPHLKLGDVIKNKDRTKFESTYREMVTACYACHKAADKPYLRTRVPERPASSMLNFDPKADWPK